MIYGIGRHQAMPIWESLDVWPLFMSNEGKLQARNKRCILLGYHNGVKGYKLFYPKSKKTLISWDVIFNENSTSHEIDKVQRQVHSTDSVKINTIEVEIVYEFETNERKMNKGSGGELIDNSKDFQFDQLEASELKNTNVQLEQSLDNYQLARDRVRR